jgi:hypothetical protein
MNSDQFDAKMMALRADLDAANGIIRRALGAARDAAAQDEADPVAIAYDIMQMLRALDEPYDRAFESYNSLLRALEAAAGEDQELWRPEVERAGMTVARMQMHSTLLRALIAPLALFEGDARELTADFVRQTSAAFRQFVRSVNSGRK